MRNLAGVLLILIACYLAAATSVNMIPVLCLGAAGVFCFNR